MLLDRQFCRASNFAETPVPEAVSVMIRATESTAETCRHMKKGCDVWIVMVEVVCCISGDEPPKLKVWEAR
jgi:hypothetical protein